MSRTREQRFTDYEEQCKAEITRICGAEEPFGEPWNTIAKLNATAMMRLDDELEMAVRLFVPRKPGVTDIEAWARDNAQIGVLQSVTFEPVMTEEEAASIRAALYIVQRWARNPACHSTETPDKIARELSAILARFGHKTS